MGIAVGKNKVFSEPPLLQTKQSVSSATPHYAWIRLQATWSSCRYPCSLQGIWTGWPLMVSSNSEDSMILWLLVERHQMHYWKLECRTDEMPMIPPHTLLHVTIFFLVFSQSKVLKVSLSIFVLQKVFWLRAHDSQGFGLLSGWFWSSSILLMQFWLFHIF